MTGNPSPGAEIRAARETRRWNQKRLAAELGTTKATVSRWEADKSAISGRWLGEVSRVLGISPTSLVKPRASARTSHDDSPDRSIPGELREAMSDPNPKHQEMWSHLGQLWRLSRKRPRGKARENWQHLVKQVETLLNEAIMFDEPSALRRRARSVSTSDE